MRGYIIRLLFFGVLLGLLTKAFDIWKGTVPFYTYFGLAFLGLVFWSLRYYVSKSSVSNPNQWVRRTMISSMLRMMAALAFLLITFLNQGKGDVVFAFTYCLYFLFYILFEMFEKRSNLRPDSHDGPKTRNA